jgi:ABC-type sugar transport system ATPase subunit
LLQYDDPRSIYREPSSRFVAEFIGRPAMNTLDGKINNGVFRCEGLELPVPDRPDGPVTLGIRPEQIVLADNGAPDSHGFTVDVIEPVEPDTLLFVKRGATSLVVRARQELTDLRPGSPLGLKLPTAALHFFDAGTGERLA